jgi:hypothetical protein
MLNSGILDFAVGIVFMFLAMSLAAGAATEAVSSFLRTRSQTLLEGIKNLVNDPDLKGLAGELYKDVLINPLVDGTKPPNRKTNPTYIDPDHFAVALTDAVKRVANQGVQPPASGNPLADFVTAIGNLPDGQIKRFLTGIIDRAKGDEQAVHDALAKWFDAAMDRVSGVYKRWTQAISFGLAFLIAALLNVSTIDVAQQLWKQPLDDKVITAIGKVPDDASKPDYLKTLEMMPIGWPSKKAVSGATQPLDPADTATNLWYFLGAFSLAWPWWSHIFGWLITAFATLFGAPFWFDALQQIVRLKGSGPSPSDKKSDPSSNTAAAAAAGAAAGAAAAAKP